MDEERKTQLDNARVLVQLLRSAYQRSYARIEENYPNVDPMDIRDAQGRFLLLDALSTLVEAEVALAKLL